MHGYLRSGDVAPAWGGVTPPDARRRVQVRSPDGTIPFVMVLVFLVARYSAAPTAMPFLAPFRPMLILAAGALGFLLVERILSGRPFRLPWPEGHALLAFLGAAALSIVYALWPRLATESTIMLAKFVLLYLIVVNVVDTRARLRRFIWMWVLAAIFPAWGTIQNYLAGNVTPSGRAHWIGIYSNANWVALEMVVLVPFAVALMVTARWWGRLFLCGALVCYLGAIFVTFSRGGILALGVLVAAGIFRLRSPTWRALAVACVIGAIAVGPQFWERNQGFDNLEDDVTFNARLALNMGGLEMLEASPLFGIGIGNSQLAGRGPGQDTAMIHNTYVQALAETGLVGFTSLMLATLVALWRMHSVAASAGHADPELYAYAFATELSIIGCMANGLASGLVLIWAPYLLIALASATTGVALAERQPEPS